MQERWDNGLARNFINAVKDIIKSHKFDNDFYDTERIGREVVSLFSEMFAEKDD